ncbi:MAG: DNA polymerase, partial [Terricaulis sp.]
DQIRLTRELVTLKDDVAVEEKWEDFALREPDPAMLLQFIDTMEFRTLGRRVREHFAKEKGVQIVASYASAAPAPAPAHADDGSRTGPVLEEIEREFKFDAYKIVRDLPALEDYIRRAKLAGAIGIDTEADSTDANRAELVGLALSIAANDAIYIPLQHKGAESRAGELFASEAPSDKSAPDTGAQISLAAALAALRPLLEDASVTKVGLNVKWDIALFTKHNIALAPYDDPMLASYTLYGGLDDHDKISLIEKHIGHGLTPYSNVAGKGKAQQSFDLVPVERAAAYSCEYADAALRLHRKLKAELASNRLITVYETLERPLPAILTAMEREGVKIDPQMLSRLSGDFAQRMAQYEAEAYGLANKEFNLGSPKQLGEILFDELKLPGGSKTKTGAWSTDATILEDLAEQHDLPAKVLEWRQLSKLRSTYTEALQAAVNPETRRVHTTYALAASTTGRLASNDPNLQNIPIRTEEGRRIREAFIAEKGNV